MDHQVFDHRNFYEKLDYDIRLARFLVIIQSPFMTLRRVSSLKPVLSACVARGVRVCVFTQSVDSNYINEEERLQKIDAFERVSNRLLSIGVHVNAVPKIHEKLVIIDEYVFWEGSLNPLSYRDTFERMTRWQCAQKVRNVMIEQNLSWCAACRETILEGEVKSVFGKIIRKRRQMMNLSQMEFSKLTGLEQSTVSRIENGKYDCRLSTVSKIFSVLKMNCRPVLWYMIPSFDYELNLSFTGAQAEDADVTS